MSSAAFRLPVVPREFSAEPAHDHAPHNIEAEEGLLAALMRNSRILDRISTILSGADDFFRADHASVYRAILSLDPKTDTIAIPVVVEELARLKLMKPERAEELLIHCLQSQVVDSNAEYYARIISDKAGLREGQDLGAWMKRMGKEGTLTTEQLLQKAEQALSSINSRFNKTEENFAQVKEWPTIHQAEVFQGVAGDIVTKMAPETEADPMAILGQFLVGFGNAIGRNPHWKAEQTRHGTNLFLCICGNSSKARKGTSLDNVLRLLSECDKEWSDNRIKQGLSSGEGMVWEIRDPIMKRMRVGGDPKLGGGGFSEQEIDPGVEDKRCLWIESEFGATLGMMNRDGSSLSGNLRLAWDGKTFGQATKNSPAKATDPHVSIIAHITEDELKKKLSDSDAANGFANRFLWMCARRSNLLPHGGDFRLSSVQGSLDHTRDAILHAKENFKDQIPMYLDQEAHRLWGDVYKRLSDPRMGLFGKIISRAEPQVKRIAAIYALLETENYIGLRHLRAALALWQYCEDSAHYIFGSSLGDSQAEKLLTAIQEAGSKGMTSTEIRRKVFGGRMEASEYSEKINLLIKAGLVSLAKDPSRPNSKVWVSASVSMECANAPKSTTDRS